MNQWPHVSSRISLEDTWGFAYRGDTPACMAEIVGIPPKFACCFHVRHAMFCVLRHSVVLYTRFAKS